MVGLTERERAARRFMEAWASKLDVGRMLLELSARKGAQLQRHDTEISESVAEAERAREFVEKWTDRLNLEEQLVDVFVAAGCVPHPKTGKYMDRNGDEYDTLVQLEKYGDMFIYLE